MSTMDPGNINATAGAAKRIYDLMLANCSAMGLSPNFSNLADTSQDAARSMMKAMCYVIAKGLIDEITANGRAVVGGALNGLQTYYDGADWVATEGPLVEKEIPLR